MVDKLKQQTLKGLIYVLQLYNCDLMNILREQDLNINQWNTLYAIGRMGPVPQATVCKVVGIKAPMCTTIVDQLENRDLLERQRNLRDRRISQVKLTEAGAQTVERIQAIVGERYLRNLDGEELKVVRNACRGLLGGPVGA